MNSAAEDAQPFRVWIEEGVVRLTWETGLTISPEQAAAAMTAVDQTTGGQALPLMVQMRGTAGLTREARLLFSSRANATRIALLGDSMVDQMLALFALGRRPLDQPIQFFTSEDGALTWLREAEPQA